MKHLIDPTDLTKPEIDEIISLAQDIIAHRERYQGSMSHKKLATLFYEPSTRTRLSFTSAMMELGGNVLGFSDARSSSVSKGESVQDTVRVVGCFADVIAMRHHIEGAQLYATEVSTVPIINAGDGSHSHPTQTLTDLLTIQRELGHIDGITIGFCGDLRFGRTVHSLIKALSRYKDIKVILIAPDELKLPDYIKQDVCERTGIPYREVTTMEEVMGELDVLYMTRVQKERFLDEDEFDRVKDSFVLDAARMALAKKKMAVLHPLPRVNEILTEVDADPRAAYFRQVENGKFVREALIVKLVEWKDDPEHGMPTDETPVEDPELRCPNKKCICNRSDRSELIGDAHLDEAPVAPGFLVPVLFLDVGDDAVADRPVQQVTPVQEHHPGLSEGLFDPCIQPEVRVDDLIQRPDGRMVVPVHAHRPLPGQAELNLPGKFPVTVFLVLVIEVLLLIEVVVETGQIRRQHRSSPADAQPFDEGPGAGR